MAVIDLRAWRRRGPDRTTPDTMVAPGPATVLPPRGLVGIGHSHLQAMIEASQLRQQADPASAPVARFVQMLAPDLNPTLMPDGRFNPALLAAIAAATGAGEDPDPLIFDCVSGNEYHFIGLVEHPRPFDFVLPGRPDLPLRDGVEIIPADLMRQAMDTQLGHAVAMLTALRAAVPGPVWHVQSPPPLPDNDYIRAHPTHFAEQVAQHGVSPPSLRMKLWLLQSDLYRAHCEALGIGFLPVPPAALDADGFLDRRGWLPDPAHASNWYGELVVQQLLAQADTVRREARA